MAFTVGFGNFSVCIIEIKGKFGVVKVHMKAGTVLYFDATFQHRVLPVNGRRISIQSYLSKRTFKICRV